MECFARVMPLLAVAPNAKTQHRTGSLPRQQSFLAMLAAKSPAIVMVLDVCLGFPVTNVATKTTTLINVGSKAAGVMVRYAFQEQLVQLVVWARNLPTGLEL